MNSTKQKILPTFVSRIFTLARERRLGAFPISRGTGKQSIRQPAGKVNCYVVAREVGLGRWLMHKPPACADMIQVSFSP